MVQCLYTLGECLRSISLLQKEPNKMVIWKARSHDRMRQFFATKKEAIAWLKYQESEDETIEKIVINDRGDMALQLNFLADLLNS